MTTITTATITQMVIKAIKYKINKQRKGKTPTGTIIEHPQYSNKQQQEQE